MTNSRVWKWLLALLPALFMMTGCLSVTAFASDPGDRNEPVLYPLTVTTTGGVSVWTGSENEKTFSEGEWVYLFFWDIPEGSEPVATYTVAGDDTVYLIDTYEDSDYGWCGKVYVFGAPGSPAEEYCKTHDKCVFVAEEADGD